jgi:ribonuclease HII
VAAAVILNPESRIEGVADSKTLSAAARTRLADQIREKALAWSVDECTPAEIDTMNILWAAMEAMRRAVSGLHTTAEFVLIDGNTDIPGLEVPSRTIIKGDSRSHSIAAASILAKTHRDTVMQKLHVQHPGFGWDSNMGYPTVAHYEGLATHGPTDHHRNSFNLKR